MQERGWDRPYIPPLATAPWAAIAVETPEEDLSHSIHSILGTITDTAWLDAKPELFSFNIIKI